MEPIANDAGSMKRISALYTISFAALIIIGTLSMAYANFMLGMILFSLGIVLVIANEHMAFKQSTHKPQFLSDLFFSPEAISEMLGFAIVAYLMPATIAIFLYFLGNASSRVLIIVFAGLVATVIKMAAKVIEFMMMNNLEKIG